MSSRVMVVLYVLAIAGLMMSSQVNAQSAAAPATQPQVSAATQPAAGSAKVLEPLPNEKGKPFAVVAKTPKAPAIDGKIEPEVWGDKPLMTGFFDEETGKPVPAKVQTQIWMLHDNDKLYIAAKMLEPEMAELQATAEEHDGNVWNDDDLEIFLDPGKKKDPSDYFQIAVNALGTSSDQRGAPDVSGDTAWDCKDCVIKTSKGKDYWTVELAIPLKSLGVTKPAAGQRWGVNFARDRKAGAGENSSWVNMGPEWHQPDQFGTVVLEP